MEKVQYLTVQALTRYIKRKFDFDPHLQDVFVKGEISNYKKHTSGHLYFTLKDNKARILAVMFSSQAKKLRFEPENGMTVLLHGEVTVYEPSGQYQIYVKEMEPEGIGALYLAFEQLKEKLSKEGLFNKDRKKPLPLYPKTVGVVTSPTGAAIRDILTTIKRRYPIAKIIIYPALVQGNAAAASIVSAIETANSRKEADLLIVGRGGGSIEELWAFNEEAVARAIFASEIPVISAVGHETDTTIADFVADLRAPTPTGAAELAVPNIDDLIERILNRKIRLIRAIKERTNVESKRLDRLTKSYAFRYPQKLFEQKTEHLDRTVEQANRLLKQKIADTNQKMKYLEQRLKSNHPQAQFDAANNKLGQQVKRMSRSFEAIFKLKEKEFLSQVSSLNVLSPLKVMERGYSIAYDSEDHIIKSINNVKVGDSIKVTLTDGTLKAKIIEREEETR
ncbi:exodeoxyribonuclease VII large subunit [Caldifermentibacillus hisashii]|uniref:exodeoxyribonuclease VII large subunit n=1 Tax=Caldifermentibacillus hisashii TaxID=996558 RepID=UPI0034D6E4E4